MFGVRVCGVLTYLRGGVVLVGQNLCRARLVLQYDLRDGHSPRPPHFDLAQDQPVSGGQALVDHPTGEGVLVERRTREEGERRRGRVNERERCWKRAYAMPGLTQQSY